MNLRRWLSLIGALGLILALSPINALAWGQPCGRAYGWYGHRPGYGYHRPFYGPGHRYPRYGHWRHYGYRNFHRPWMGRHGGPYAPTHFRGYSAPYYGYGPYRNL